MRQAALFPAASAAQADALLQQTLKAAAAAAQVEIEGLQVLQPASLGGASRIGVRLKGRADIAALDRLLYAIETFAAAALSRQSADPVARGRPQRRRRSNSRSTCRGSRPGPRHDRRDARAALAHFRPRGRQCGDGGARAVAVAAASARAAYSRAVSAAQRRMPAAGRLPPLPIMPRRSNGRCSRRRAGRRRAARHTPCGGDGRYRLQGLVIAGTTRHALIAEIASGRSVELGEGRGDRRLDGEADRRWMAWFSPRPPATATLTLGTTGALPPTAKP